MEILVLLPIIWIVVYLIFRKRPQETSIQEEPVGWNSFRHNVSDVKGKFVVEEAFKTKRAHYALRIRNLKTGESRTLYGKDPYDVYKKKKKVFHTWEMSLCHSPVL